MPSDVILKVVNTLHRSVLKVTGTTSPHA